GRTKAPADKRGPCSSSFKSSRSLPFLLRVIGLRLSEISLRGLHELGLGLFTAEAIGLASNLPIDGAVGLYVLAHRETHRAHVVVLAGYGQGCGGHAKQQSARNGG